MSRITSLDVYHALYRQSVEDPASFWEGEARRLRWFHPFDRVLDVDVEEVDFSWFDGGKLNACYNCVDRHARETPDKDAIVWVGNEPGQIERISFRQLEHRVSRVANVLLRHGVRKGDRVILYMPMIPELAYTVLACARIGAVHSVVFGGFSAEALRDRIVDAAARVVVTADEVPRGPKIIPLKTVVDQALDGLDVDAVLVAQRTGRPVPMKEGRDRWLHEETDRVRSTCPVEWMSSEDPLFILYTSGSTGRPKGVLHTTGGYLTYALSTFRWVFDARPEDVHFCTADIGWITGHSYILYGPLANGTTTVMFEGVPTHPTPSRYWEVVDEVGATIFYTAPTALRTLMRTGNDPVRSASRASLRILGTVGEPINPEVWRWYFEVVGDGRCPVVDTWWQTETGGVMIAPLPGVVPPKPGSATLPFFGVRPVLMDERGDPIEGPGHGNLCLQGSWPGQARTLWGDHRRFRETYFTHYPGYYFTGDGCTRDGDGYYWITGRVDDVLNVSGHRIGTAEVESALVAHPTVAEAAVVGFPHPLKGQGILAFVHTRPAAEELPHGELVGALKEAVRQAIGSLAVPDRIVVVPGLPKTRSGKIMRRILRKVGEGELDSLGDLSTLADPAVVDEIIRLTEGRSA